jgi:ankyrin repeat protein
VKHVTPTGVLCAAGLLTCTLAAGQAPGLPPDAELRAKAGKAVALLQATAATWERKQTCFSCHHQGLILSTLRLARERGVPFDEAAARASAAAAFKTLDNLDIAVTAALQIDPAMATGSWLVAARESGVAPSLATEVYARSLTNRQERDGSWITIDQRPPQSFSPVTATAIAVRALQEYAPASHAADTHAAVARARAWLQQARVRDTEDRNFQLFGLAWTGQDAAGLRPFVDRTLAGQRADGGWSQLPNLASDAYATGETLVALNRAGRLPTADPAWQKGLRFLLNAQKPDGSWLVGTRVHEQDLVSPPYFETGFPYGRDQITSCMATAWAAMAIMQALPIVVPDATLASPAGPATRTAAAPAKGEAWMRAALFGTRDELSALLDAGLDPNSRTPRGTTLLMMAAHDPAKVRLLLAKGANARLASDSKHTAVMIAANHRGAIESMRLLLDAGASPDLPPAPPGRASAGAKGRPSPMLYAIWSGETEKVALLLERGAKLPRKMSIAGIFFATPLELATLQHDLAMVKYLGSRGVDVNELGELGTTPLFMAVAGNDDAMVRALLSLGASVNLVDQQGETALMHAALIDYGDTAVIDTLLAAGADRDVRSPDKLTARDMALKHGHGSHSKRLETQ